MPPLFDSPRKQSSLLAVSSQNTKRHILKYAVLYFVTPRGIEPRLPPWEGDVLAARRWSQCCYTITKNSVIPRLLLWYAHGGVPGTVTERTRNASRAIAWRFESSLLRHFAIFAFSAEFGAELCSAGVVLCAKRAEFARICHAPRGQKEMFWFWIWKFVVLVWWEKLYQTSPEFCFRKTTNLFCFACRRNLEAIIFNILTYDKY